MREILFRGKLKAENGELKKGDWVYGDFVTLIDGKEKHLHIYGKGEVKAETIGQFTGLTDKNGTKIFEGDIVKHHRTLWGADNSDVGIIQWRQTTCKFYRTSKFDTVHIVELWEGASEEYEVIGNIHDNPEILESEVQGE